MWNMKANAQPDFLRGGGWAGDGGSCGNNRHDYLNMPADFRNGAGSARGPLYTDTFNSVRVGHGN